MNALERVPPDRRTRRTTTRADRRRARRTTSRCRARRSPRRGTGRGCALIDASNARNLRQVGYYYVTGTDAATNPSSLSWDIAWRGDLVYLFDMDRGIEILRLKGGPHASASLATVREPKRGPDPLAAVPVSGLTPGSLVCPLFARQ